MLFRVQETDLSKTFYITEVFSEHPYGGNQLATFVDAASIPAGDMQKIARAINFAETTFIVGGEAGQAFDVRIFTPSAELPFAGHPTLGSAYIAREIIARAPLREVRLNLKVGEIPVTFAADGVCWMRQQAPEFGATVDRSRVASALGLEPEDLMADFPCQHVSTGLPFLIAPVKSLAELRAISISSNDFGEGLFAFCAEGYEPGQAIAARMFASSYGVSEDAATGSANGCLAAYLCEHRFFGETDVDVKVGQGYEVSRPSQLYLRAAKTNGIEIDVGGRVRLVAAGEWYL